MRLPSLAFPPAARARGGRRGRARQWLSSHLSPHSGWKPAGTEFCRVENDTWGSPQILASLDIVVEGLGAMRLLSLAFPPAAPWKLDEIELCRAEKDPWRSPQILASLEIVVEVVGRDALDQLGLSACIGSLM